MKKTILSLVAAITLVLATSTAYAWWQANANVTVTTTRVESAVYNGTARPMYCQGTVTGLTYSGQRLVNSSGGWVAPNGGWGTIYVYTSLNNPFVDGWANVECRW